MTFSGGYKTPSPAEAEAAENTDPGVYIKEGLSHLRSQDPVAAAFRGRVLKYIKAGGN